ncbi:hypothetical protein N9J26_00640 [bacterium]|nr:hypothetical protein [bacterium]
MDLCQVKTGIFIERNCQNPVDHHCYECGLGICENHTVVDNTSPFCHACYINNNPTDIEDDSLTHSNRDHHLWYSRRRLKIHRSSRIVPFTQAEHHAFDQPATAEHLLDNDADDFFDS